MKGYLKNIISYYSSALIINSQPRRRGVRSHSVLFFYSHLKMLKMTLERPKRPDFLSPIFYH